MRYTDAKKLQKGMILGKSLYALNGQMLLAADSIIKEEYITRILELGYAGVYVKDDFSTNVETKDIITPELKLSAIQKLKDIYIIDTDNEKDSDGMLRQIMDVQDLVSDIVENVIVNKDVMINMLDLKIYDDYTYFHSVNVTVLAIAVGVSIGLNKDELNMLGMAGMLHDIGKKFISKQVLNKPSRLTDDEYKNMKEHATYGYMYIKENFNLSPKVYVGILQHHERYNGSGYPDGRKGKEIGVFAKILAVVDVYDALISKRPYREPSLNSEALEYIMGGSGTLFDPDVVKAFSSRIAAYPVGVEVTLSNGMQGLVVENFRDSNTRPKVKVIGENDHVIYVDLKNDPQYFNVTIVGVV